MEKYSRAEQATDGYIIWRMRFAGWVTKAADTRSEYVILPPQQWLHERASVLRYLHIACVL